MPYKVAKSGNGYKVKNRHSGKTYSKKPLSKSKAKAQMAAIYANTNEAFERLVDKALDTLLERKKKQSARDSNPERG